MKIKIDACPMVVSNKLKFLFARHYNVEVFLANSGSAIKLIAVYEDKHGERHESVLGDL